MAAALKILARRACSEAQLRERLIDRAGKDPVLVEACINRLKEMGYVNDDMLAHAYARSRVSLKPVGRSRVARELANKKVPRKAIEEALDMVFDETAEDKLIDKAIARRVRSRGRPVDRAAARRMFAHLARLGFDYDLIVRKLRALKAMTDETN